MSHFRLIAFDMDGTLLRSDLTISPEDMKAVHEAKEAGKRVAIASGRSISEIRHYQDEGLFADFHYAVLESGALLYNIRRQEILSRRTFDAETVFVILDMLDKEDIMPQAMMNGATYLQSDDLNKVADHGMGAFQQTFEETQTLVPDIRTFIREHAGELEKINLYHVSREASVRTNDRLKAYPIERMYAEGTALELSPAGVDKGFGLKELCRLVDIPISEAIAVGDADNDLPMLRAAGLGIAMGNACDNVKKEAGTIVADDDHNGCAQAIREYLLKD